MRNIEKIVAIMLIVAVATVMIFVVPRGPVGTDFIATIILLLIMGGGR